MDTRAPGMKVIQFCAEECERQRTSPIAVYNMVDAYNAAERCYSSNTKHIQPWLITLLGRLVEPDVNISGWRKVPVVIDSLSILHSNIVDNIAKLCGLTPDDYNEQTAKEFYFYFERIHPFADGNGRVGAILYNWINGTLYEPIAAPNMFGGN